MGSSPEELDPHRPSPVKLIRDALRPLSLALLAMTVLLSLLQVLAASTAADHVILLVAAPTVAAFGVIVLMTRRHLSERATYALATTMAALVILNLLTYQWLTSSAQFSLLALTLTACAVFVLDRRWLAGLVAGSLLAWLAMDVLHDREIAPQRAVTMVVIVAVAALINAIQRRYIMHLTEAYDRLHALAYTDELTGLLNRRGFLAAAEAIDALARRSGQSLTVLYIDLNGLKKINDLYGHTIGDHAIYRLGQLLQLTFRSSDLVGHLSGDEFCVLLTGASDRGERAIAKLRDETRNANRYSDLQIDFTVGVGHRAPSATRSLNALMIQADKAMQRNKPRRWERDGKPVPRSKRAAGTAVSRAEVPVSAQ